MAITIDATAGGTGANSFVLLTEAETYMEGRGNKALWTAATDADKDIALAEATRDIDLKEYTGYRTTSTQALSWPRISADDPDNPVQGWFDDDVVPSRIKNATSELAFQYLKAGTTDIAALDAKINVRSKQVDVLRTEYFSPTYTPTGLARYPRVMAFLGPLLAYSGNSIPLVRG